MTNTAVIDLFLGDSGKGKIVDYLAPSFESVIRYHGSNNAGHTLVLEGKTYKTHSLPSGVLYKGKNNFIAHGCTMDPSVLSNEIEQFRHFGSNIFIAGEAHIIQPRHIRLDKHREKHFKIGSTKRGVAPAYESKVARQGIQFKDLLLTQQEFLDRVSNAFASSKYGWKDDINPITELLNLKEKLAPTLERHIVVDGVDFLHNHLLKKGPALFEGAQGTFLDVDVGYYPYVTSSNCTIGSVFTGTGLNPSQLAEVIGIIKGYGSYVGTNQSFQDIEQQNLSDLLSNLGQEYGATTGRKRRLCWLDLDQIKKACMINGPTKLVITKLDILGLLPKVFLKHNGQLVEFQSWGDISHAKLFTELDKRAIEYIEYIEAALQVPIWAVGNGPDRTDIILK